MYLDCRLKLSKFVLEIRKTELVGSEGLGRGRKGHRKDLFADGKGCEKVGTKGGCHVRALMSFVGEVPQLAETSTDETP